MIIDRAVVAMDAATVLGFVLNQQRHPRSAEITNAAVHPGRRREGIGSMVLRRVLTDLGASGIALAEVR